jgi:hypothetical protein
MLHLILQRVSYRCYGLIQIMEVDKIVFDVDCKA